MEWLEPESDVGNVEYKLRLKDNSTVRFQQLVRCSPLSMSGLPLDWTALLRSCIVKQSS